MGVFYFYFISDPFQFCLRLRDLLTDHERNFRSCKDGRNGLRLRLILDGSAGTVSGTEGRKTYDHKETDDHKAGDDAADDQRTVYFFLLLGFPGTGS